MTTSLKQPEARSVSPSGRRATLDLVLIVLALGLVVVTTVTSDWVTSGETLGRSGHVLVEFRRELVTEIRIERAGRRLALKRGASLGVSHGGAAPAQQGSTHDGARHTARWLVTKPFESEADESTADQLLRAVSFARALRKLPAETDTSGLAFDAPRWAMTLTHGGEVYELRLGSEAPTPPGASYLRVKRAGRAPEVMVVSSSTASELGPPLDDFRVRGVFPYVGRKARALSVQSAASPRWQVLGKGERWRFDPKTDGPLAGARLSRAAMRGFWAQLARTRFSAFVDLKRARALQTATLGQLGKNGDAPASPMRTDEVALRLELHPRNTKDPKAVITIGGACPDAKTGLLVIRHAPEPTAGCVSEAGWGDFSVAPTQLVDTGLFFARPDEVAAVQIQQGGRELDFARDGTSFVLRAPRRTSLEASLTEDRLGRILRISGSITTPPAAIARKAAAQAPSHWVELTLVESLDTSISPQGAATERVALWQDGDGTYAQRADGMWLAMRSHSEPSLAALLPDNLLLRKASVWELTREEIASIEVKTPDWRQRLEATSPRQFALAEPAGFGADASLTRDLTSALTQLRAERWVRENWRSEFGLSAPKVAIRIGLSKGKGSRQLLIGAPAVDGGRYASIGEDEAVFLLADAAVRRLSQLVLDRTALMLASEDLQSLTVERHGRKIALHKGPAGLLQTQGLPSLNERRRQDLLDALAQLRAQSAVALSNGSNSNNEAWGLNKVTLRVRAKLRDGKAIEYFVGQGDVYRDMSVFFAQVVGETPVYALPRRSVVRVLDNFNL